MSDEPAYLNADKKNVEEMLNYLNMFWGALLNRGDYSNLDSLMGLHNFHKLQVGSMAEQQENNLASIMILEMAKNEFSKAIDIMLLKYKH